MTLPGLYLDEDAQSGGLIQALRARGITVLTTTEAGMLNRSDHEQLLFAFSKNLVLVTYNVADFAAMHSRWLASGDEHAGIIAVRQQKWSPGELARRIIRLLTAIPGANMRQRLEFISNW